MPRLKSKVQVLRAAKRRRFSSGCAKNDLQWEFASTELRNTVDVDLEEWLVRVARAKAKWQSNPDIGQEDHCCPWSGHTTIRLGLTRATPQQSCSLLGYHVPVLLFLSLA